MHRAVVSRNDCLQYNPNNFCVNGGLTFRPAGTLILLVDTIIYKHVVPTALKNANDISSVRNEMFIEKRRKRRKQVP